MAKGSATIDISSLRVAGQTATNFFSVDNSGIMIYDGSNGTQTPSNPDVNTNNVFIDPDSLDIRKGTNVLATFSAEETRVGSYEGSNIRLGELGISAKKSGGSEYFNVGIIGNEQQYVSVSKDDTGRGAFAWLTGSGGSDEDFINLHSAIASGGVFGVSLKITVDYNTSSSDHRYSGTLTRTYKYEAFHKGTSYTYTKMNSSPNIEEARIEYSTYPNTNIWYVNASVNSAFLDWYFDYGWRYARVVLKMYATVNTTAPAYSFGINTDVSKKLGFAIGNGTIPSEVGLAMGKYNLQDTNDDYVLIIGNGTSSTPSNALTVDWNGNMVIPNNSAYKSKNLSGDERRLCYISTTNGYIYGYDSYQNSEGGSYLYGNTTNIRSKGAISIGYSNDNNTITIAGATSITGATSIAGNLNITGQYQRHGNTYIVTDSRSKDNVRVPGTSSSDNSYVTITVTNIDKDGYIPIAVVNYNFQNATTNGSNSSNIMCYGCSFDTSDNTASVKVRNLTSSDARIKVTVRILYRAV